MSGPDKTRKRKAAMKTTEDMVRHATATAREPSEHARAAHKAAPQLSTATIEVTTKPGHSPFAVSREAQTGKPRKEFVDDLVRMMFGTQGNGKPHEWRTKD